MCGMHEVRSGDVPSPQAEETSAPDTGELFQGLRGPILNLEPGSVGLRKDRSGATAWGCLMETGCPNCTATLVCLGDGTTSLYTSSGFGIIGGGAHEQVVRESAALLSALESHLSDMAPSTDQSLPGLGRTIIRALTFDGQRNYEAAEAELGEGRSPLSPVFRAAHGVITQLRGIDEANR